MVKLMAAIIFLINCLVLVDFPENYIYYTLPVKRISRNDAKRYEDAESQNIFLLPVKNTESDSAKLASQPLEETVKVLKQQAGKDVFVGSRSLIIELTNLNLIDEYQLCVHPVVVGKGLPLFDKIIDRTIFKLLKTKLFSSGAVLLYYSRATIEEKKR